MQKKNWCRKKLTLSRDEIHKRLWHVLVEIVDGLLEVSHVRVCALARYVAVVGAQIVRADPHSDELRTNVIASGKSKFEIFTLVLIKFFRQIPSSDF
jgi:hypothetical protein